MDVFNFIILLSPSVLIISAMIFAATMRYITYRERVALVERGVDMDALLQSQHIRAQGNRGVLWAGTITASSGLAILFGLWMLGQGVWLLAGFLPLFIGIGILAIYYVTRGTSPQPLSIPTASTTRNTSVPPEPSSE